MGVSMKNFEAKNSALQELLKLLMPSMMKDMEVKKEMEPKEMPPMMDMKEEDNGDDSEEPIPTIHKGPKIALSLTRIVADQKADMAKKKELDKKKDKK
jgi:hypothetical protein